jgi:hypothetical protein
VVESVAEDVWWVVRVGVLFVGWWQSEVEDAIRVLQSRVQRQRINS